MLVLITNNFAVNMIERNGEEIVISADGSDDRNNGDSSKLKAQRP